MTESSIFNKNNGLIVAVLGLTALLLVMLNDSLPAEEINQDITENAISAPIENSRSASEKTMVPYNAPAPDLEKSGDEFVLYKGIKDVLDNLILSADSTDKDTIMALAQRWCESQGLSAAGCSDFEALFARYIDYKIAMASYESLEGRSGDLLQQLRARLSELQALRYQWFTEEEVLALFGEDQQTDELALERREIAMAADLSREQKLDLIEQHYAGLPEEQRSHLEPTFKMHQLDSIKTQYEDKQLRLLEAETQFGYEAAQRLAETWQQQDAFQHKIEQVAEAYRALKENSSASLKEQQLQFLAQHFSGNEVRRARVILKTHSN